MAKAKRVAGKYKPTAKEIMEEHYRDLWESTNAIVKELVKVQDLVIGMLSGCKENLPKNFEVLETQKAQCCLLDYIRLRLLYEFTRELWKSIDDQCRDLVKKHNDGDEYEETDPEAVLRQILNAISSFPFEEIAKDKVAGILRFNENYMHKHFEQWVGNTHFESWRCDVMGGIREHGMQCDWLWRDAVDYRIPDRSNICELLPDKEINKNS